MNPEVKKKIDGQAMRDLADGLKKQMPGIGFALLVFDFENDSRIANYISNVQEEFMIKALEHQLDALRKGKTFATTE